MKDNTSLHNNNTVIFDMYGTLVPNTVESWISLFRNICLSQRFGTEPQMLYQEWKTLEIEFRRSRLNLDTPNTSPPFRSYEEAWRECFRDVFTSLRLRGDATAAAKAAVEAMADRELYTEVSQVLNAIQSHWKTALLSNADNDYLLPLLDKLGLTFQGVCSSEDVRSYKPDSVPFLHILDMLGEQPEDAVYVGDNPYDDILGATRVGMKTVWVNRTDRPYDDSLPGPNYEIKSLSELPEILTRWEE